jgi:hypothetical protein
MVHRFQLARSDRPNGRRDVAAAQPRAEILLTGSSGSAWEQAALTVEWWREHAEGEPDWWAAGEPHRRR